ncbi:hypothetical protein LTR05_006739 [Lithohypha guttulata]|uniref:Methyltransferase type 11 domain-containing protein n=1 Tax=Lithohypha guttulata TaxID=1690604 RepID=A0AAN7SVP7_9EURO|nr:hypothetical protein LTR05_006739 [Lithohypha guttulata]
MSEERKQQYFGELAPRYSHLTGDTTQDLFAKFLESHPLDISSSSIIHDNAAGPGTATEILVQRAAPSGVSPRIVATDYSAGMIARLEEIKTAWPEVTVEAKVIDSSDLSCFEKDYFTHSINNFSLFTFTHPVQSLKETYRTLKPSGTAVVLVWKLFAVQGLLATAQDIVKGPGYAKANAIPVNGAQYYQEGFVSKQLVEAGFEKKKLETIVVEHVLKEDDRTKWDGLFEFMTKSSIAASSIKGWSPDEAASWPDAIKQAIATETQKHGGVKFEAWVTVAKK